MINSGGYKNIVFDCDGTLVKIEGIDELGKMAGKEREVSRITRLAMNGRMPFEKALPMRLDAIQPKRSHLERVGRKYVRAVVKDAREVIEALHFLSHTVYIVAGGYDIPIHRLAEHLGIPRRRVYANTLRFDRSGNYCGLKPGPCTKTTGKAEVLRKIRKTGPTLFVGDGAIDVACQDAVDCFIGYGGVSRRPAVRAKAKNYLFAESLAPVLALAAGGEGVRRLGSTRFRLLVNRGLRITKNPTMTKLETA